MKRKARIQTGIDDRLVAIYARKSRITNKGDSIGVQFKQSADYAINQLSLPEDYEFARYEDKGLSGYYSDRPDFQRLLRDIEMGKIKAVACYKLDRISRKTSDLMRLLEYFERHDVTLLVCSNNINTRISTSKIIIQVLAIIAEFERDILTERIQDNLMELAKDGRWLGGKTPTGFSSQRVTTGSGKNKSAISFLVPVQEEKEIVLEIYGTFWETRSLLQTANIISEKYETKHGAKFTTSTIRLILRNPIYCVADEYSYNYFLEHDGNLFGEPSDFDGQHGLTAYNKTDQMKVENEDSTFFNPKFSQLLTRKPISEWIVSVGRHEGFISSRKWVETQNMLDEIAEKYNRPHRKTNALLSGLMYCPICGKRLRVLPESNRWTNGKPRFKYACPGVRAKECTFKGVEGVTLDEFVIHSLSSLQEEYSDYYRQLLENRVASMIRTDQSEKEYQETKKAIERLNADIAAQVRNLREADDALKRFIQDDIKELTDELAKREAALRRMEDTQSENQYLVHELNGMKKRLLSFEEFAKDAQPEALFTLVHSIVDRIYITTDGTKQKCQVYIKGCATEDYSDVLGAAGYIEEEPLLPVVSYMPPMCDLDYYSILYFRIHSVLPQPSIGRAKASVPGHFKPSLHRVIVVRVKILCRYAHVPVLRLAPVGTVFLGQFTQRLCRHTRDQGVRRDDLALRYERRLGHDAARADLTAEAEHRAHADTGLRADHARVDDRAVADGHATRNGHDGVLPAGMDDNAVLDRDLLLEDDTRGVGADDGIRADIAARADDHIADELRARTDERCRVDLWGLPVKGIEHRFSPFMKKGGVSPALSYIIRFCRCRPPVRRRPSAEPELPLPAAVPRGPRPFCG